MNVDIETLPEQRLATVRHIGPYPLISQAFARLGQAVAQGQLRPTQGGMVALYYDDPETTPVAELRSDAGLCVDEEAEISPPLAEQRLPAGRYAKYVHQGPYAALSDVWPQLLGQWLPQSGHQMGDSPAFERYLNTPGDVPESELLTELYVPLVPAAAT